MCDITAQDAYWSAVEWIVALPLGSAFTRIELVIEMRYRHMYPARCNGSYNLAIRHCLSNNDIIVIPNDRWMRT